MLVKFCTFLKKPEEKTFILGLRKGFLKLEKNQKG